MRPEFGDEEMEAKVRLRHGVDTLLPIYLYREIRKEEESRGYVIPPEVIPYIKSDALDIAYAEITLQAGPTARAGPSKTVLSQKNRETVKRIVEETVARWVKKLKLEAKKRREGVGNGTASYWIAEHPVLAEHSGGESNHFFFFFCRTADGSVFHARADRLAESVLGGEPLAMTPWPFVAIGNNGRPTRKRKRLPKGKEKVVPVPAEGEPEIPGPPPAKRLKFVDLPAEMAAEVVRQWIEHISPEPTPAMRRLIFPFLTPGVEPNVVSRHLAKRDTIFAWYREVFDGKVPPARLVHLSDYYGPEDFARRWYSTFVREYDMALLRGVYFDAWDSGWYHLSEVMTDPVLHLITMHLRGRTIGAGDNDETGALDMELVEMEIRKAFDVLKVGRPDLSLASVVLDNALFRLMILMGESWDESDLVRLDIFEEMLRRPGDDESDPEFYGSEGTFQDTSNFIEMVVEPIIASSVLAVRVIRGLGEGKGGVMTAGMAPKDLAAVVWLATVTMHRKRGGDQTSLQDILDPGSRDYIRRIREAMREVTRSEEQREIEDKVLSEGEREAAFEARENARAKAEDKRENAWKTGREGEEEEEGPAPPEAEEEEEVPFPPFLPYVPDPGADLGLSYLDDDDPRSVEELHQGFRERWGSAINLGLFQDHHRQWLLSLRRRQQPMETIGAKPVSFPSPSDVWKKSGREGLLRQIIQNDKRIEQAQKGIRRVDKRRNEAWNKLTSRERTRLHNDLKKRLATKMPARQRVVLSAKLDRINKENTELRAKLKDLQADKLFFKNIEAKAKANSGALGNFLRRIRRLGTKRTASSIPGSDGDDNGIVFW